MKGHTLPLVVLAGAALAGCGTSGSSGAAAPGPAAAPARFTYQPASVQYVSSSHGRVEQEFGGQVTSTEVGLRYFLSLAAVEDGDVTRVTLTIDSVPVVIGPGVPPGMAERSAGSTFTGILTSEGEILDFQGGDTTIVLVRQLADRLERIFPRIPPGGVAPGQAWTDSVETESGSSGFDLLIEVVSENQARDWVEHAGAAALLVENVSNYQISGGGIQGGTEISLDGTGITRGEYYLAADGRLLGGVSADSMSATAMVVAAGTMIPITQVRLDSLSIVR